MKSLFVVFLAIVAILVSSCNNVDPIWGTDPVDSTYAAGFPLDQFHKLGIAGDTVAQKALVDQYRKQLTKNVINNHPCIKEAANIKFVFGSGEVENLFSGDGKAYSGKFKNELLIILDDPCVKDTLFLACGNGQMSSIRWKNKADWGRAEKCRFEILPGQGLAHHLPALQEWAKIAGDFDIPIRDKSGKIVSQEKYLNYLGKYESVLFPGDVIDMCASKVFNKVGQEVLFDRRLEESEKANALAKKSQNVGISSYRLSRQKVVGFTFDFFY